jgi:acyl-coenzyme A synthetase/AMP-(fatty) acid ligase
VHCGRPLFPEDVAAALAEIPAPRILVTTPVHLRALVRAARPFPAVALVVCATAPLDGELASAAEKKFDCVVLDFFGSTETCVIATRRPVQDDAWSLYKGVALIPAADGTRAEAPWFAEPTLLQDVVELLPDGRFLLRGRNADMIEIAGKRASLQDLTQRLLAVPGVQDAVVFLPETADQGPVKRVSALVVAPDVSAASVLGALRAGVDEAFLPRPLVIVPALPRSEAGKLPRHQLLAALAAGTR